MLSQKTDIITQVKAMYDAYSARYTQQYTEPSKTVDDFIALLSEKASILEVGCGPGVDANYFTEKRFHVVATDASPNMIQNASQQFPSVDFRVQDMRQLDFQASSFDGLYAESSLIHIPKRDMKQTLQSFYRILRVGGILALGLQEGESTELVRPAPFAPEEMIFLNIMSHDETRRLIEDAGFVIVKDYSLQPRPQGQHPFIKRKLFAKKGHRPDFYVHVR